MQALALLGLSMGDNLLKGLHELLQAVSLKDTWLYCGLQDIRLRYRRSFLGPWWLTASTAVTIGILGLLWSQIFQSDITTYMPFFAIGHVTWIWISSQINDAATGFTQFGAIVDVRFVVDESSVEVMV